MEIDLRQASPKPQTLEEAQKVIDALWEVLLKQGRCDGHLFITVLPDFDTVWAHIWKNPNEFNGLNWEFRQTPRYMDC